MKNPGPIAMGFESRVLFGRGESGDRELGSARLVVRLLCRS